MDEAVQMITLLLEDVEYQFSYNKPILQLHFCNGCKKKIAEKLLGGIGTKNSQLKEVKSITTRRKRSSQQKKIKKRRNKK